MMGTSYFRSDHFYYRCLGWNLKFALFPKYCDLTKKRIWFKYAYRGTAMYHGPGTPVVEYRWHDKLEHIIWKLKNE